MYVRAGKRSCESVLYKKGNPDSATSYRPISVIPILQSIMQQQLKDHFKRDRLFTDSQYGFRKGRSTNITISSLAEDAQVAVLKTKKLFSTWLRRAPIAFEDKDSVNLVLCDLSTAFNCVSHEKLVKKLES